MGSKENGFFRRIKTSYKNLFGRKKTKEKMTNSKTMLKKRKNYNNIYTENYDKILKNFLIKPNIRNNKLNKTKIKMNIETEFLDLNDRKLLFTWLYKIKNHLNFNLYTFFNSFSIIDKFIIEKIINKENAQLYSLTIIYISGKILEPNQGANIEQILSTTNKFKFQKIINTEKEIAKILNFDFLKFTILDSVVFMSQILTDLDIYKYLELIVILLSFKNISEQIPTIKKSIGIILFIANKFNIKNIKDKLPKNIKFYYKESKNYADYLEKHLKFENLEYFNELIIDIYQNEIIKVFGIKNII